MWFSRFEILNVRMCLLCVLVPHSWLNHMGTPKVIAVSDL